MDLTRENALDLFTKLKERLDEANAEPYTYPTYYFSRRLIDAGLSEGVIEERDGRLWYKGHTAFEYPPGCPPGWIEESRPMPLL